MKFFNKMLAAVFASVIAFTPMAAVAQVFDPMSKSGFNTVTGTILYANGIPVVTGTGTPTIASGSSNTAGIVTAGASATSVVITFATNAPWNSVPSCIVTPQTGGIASFAYAVTRTAITVTQSATSGDLINYRCDPTS